MPAGRLGHVDDVDIDGNVLTRRTVDGRHQHFVATFGPATGRLLDIIRERLALSVLGGVSSTN